MGLNHQSRTALKHCKNGRSRTNYREFSVLVFNNSTYVNSTRLSGTPIAAKAVEHRKPQTRGAWEGSTDQGLHRAVR